MPKRSTNEGWYSGRSVGKKKFLANLHIHREISFATPESIQSTCKGASAALQHAVPPDGIKVHCEGGLAGRFDFILPRIRAVDLRHRTDTKLSTRSSSPPVLPFCVRRRFALQRPCGARPAALLHPNQGAVRGSVGGESNGVRSRRRDIHLLRGPETTHNDMWRGFVARPGGLPYITNQQRRRALGYTL